MPEAHDIPDRVAALERDVGRMRGQLSEAVTDAQAARMLAGGADRDVSDVRAELRAHTRAISALHDDQVDLRTALYELSDETRRGFAKTEQAFATINAQTEQAFATVNTGMARIVELLEP